MTLLKTELSGVRFQRPILKRQGTARIGRLSQATARLELFDLAQDSVQRYRSIIPAPKAGFA